jgi:CTP synthase
MCGWADLRAVGLSPDVIVCRSKSPLDPAVRQKISDFCHVSVSQVVSVHDVSNIYHVPLMLAQQNVHETLR